LNKSLTVYNVTDGRTDGPQISATVNIQKL